VKQKNYQPMFSNALKELSKGQKENAFYQSINYARGKPGSKKRSELNKDCMIIVPPSNVSSQAASPLMSKKNPIAAERMLASSSSQNLTKGKKKSVPINNHIVNRTYVNDVTTKIDSQSATTDARSSQVNNYLLSDKKGFAFNNYQNLQ
jgi:hypothetical protein